MVCGSESLGSEPQFVVLNQEIHPHKPQTTTVNAKAIIFHGAGERNRGSALLMMANKPET